MASLASRLRFIQPVLLLYSLPRHDHSELSCEQLDSVAEQGADRYSPWTPSILQTVQAETVGSRRSAKHKQGATQCISARLRLHHTHRAAALRDDRAGRVEGVIEPGRGLLGSDQSGLRWP